MPEPLPPTPANQPPPRRGEQPSPAPDDVPVLTAGSVVEVLYVEDNPSDLKLALRSFRSSNFTNPVHVVRDGAEALEYIFRTGRYQGRGHGSDPKVILLDLKLPLVDGLEVLRQIKADPSTRQIPVVVLTSSREERDLVESYQLGVNGYVVKPLGFNQLTEVIRSLGMYWLLVNQTPRYPHAPAGGDPAPHA